MTNEENPVDVKLTPQEGVLDSIIARSSILAESNLDWADVRLVAEEVLESAGYSCEECGQTGGRDGEADLLLTYQTTPYEFEEEEDALTHENLAVVCTSCYEGTAEVAASAPAGTSVREHVEHSLSRFERFVASNTPSIAIARYGRQVVGVCALLATLAGVAGYILNNWSPFYGARLIATLPYWGIEWLVANHPFVFFGGLVVPVLGLVTLLNYYVPDELFEGKISPRYVNLALSGVILTGVLWIPSYLEAVLGVNVPGVTTSQYASLLAFAQGLVWLILIPLPKSDQTLIMDRSIVALAYEKYGTLQGNTSVKIARDESIPLAGKSFYPLLWTYLGHLSVVWFIFAFVYEDVLISSMWAPFVVIAFAAPTLVAVLYKFWRGWHIVSVWRDMRTAKAE